MNEKDIRRITFTENPRVSVVIPSFDGVRDGNVERLLDDLREQTLTDLEVIVVIGVSPQGTAINRGVAASQGEILVVLDDDSRPGQLEMLANLVGLLDSDPTLGMVGASVIQPLEANWLQRQAARGYPRLSMPVVDEVTDSDMACHGGCALRREVFDAIGGERENILRGLDPDLRQRLRDAGYRVVLAPQTTVLHPLPATLRKFVRMLFRNGMGSAYIQRHHPDLVYETDERTAWKGQSMRAPFPVRLLRYPFRSLASLCRGNVMRVLGDGVYAVGVVWGMWKYRRKP